MVFGDVMSKDFIALFNDFDSRGVRLFMVEKFCLLLCYVSLYL